ncbi:hypothetical protein TWF694_006694 [Orbilia ellipsospora]|uniref:Uncharacterized protein n=1 Tax=Orbilia ellipsospora TaxID=2528407 RepID=A0AAV9XL02_9PEZI
MMKPRRKYNMVPLDGSAYVNPAFEGSNSPSKNYQSKTDPLPFAAKFEPLTHSLLPEEPSLPPPPIVINTPPTTPKLINTGTNNPTVATVNWGPIMSTSPPLVSPISPEPNSQRFSARSSVNSTLSVANSTTPILDKRPSRFQSDFNYLRRTSWQKSPDPSFKSHRRTFSQEAKTYRTSAFREEVLEEDEDTPANNTPNNGVDLERNTGNGTTGAFQSVPLDSTATTGLGLRYVPADEGAMNKSSYSNVPPDDDDDSSDEGKSIKKGRPTTNWLSIIILILSIYSTLGSALFFLIAVIRPRYGTKISTTSGLKPQDAQLISAILAKTIELSFVSVFVSFLGQVLSRRALMTGSKGVNIAELSMRTWVTQPGTLLTNTSSLKFAGLTFLGALSLTATIFASFYTTAADTLVSPKLGWGGFQTKNLTGLAYTSYANSTYRVGKCQTVIPDAEDPVYGGYAVPLAKSTCDAILSAGRGYRDVSDWNELWAESQGQSFPDPLKRPPAPSSLDLINYAGTWLHISGDNGINRAVMAMPHPGIIAATRNSSLNGILQPEDAGSGYGSFMVKASVPNPVVDVTCSPVLANRAQWYVAQSNLSDYSRNGTFDPQIQQLFNFTNDPTFYFDSKTEKFPILPYAAPRFFKLPIVNNTVVASAPGDPSTYFLTRTPANNFVMCGVKSFMTPNCSSEFQAFDSSGNATVNCDLTNSLSFKADLARHNVSTVDHPIAGAEGAPVGDFSYADFREVSFGTFLSTSLNTGVSDSNASIAHFLSQLALDTVNSILNPYRPSLAEALAVLLGNAMITSAVDTVFTTYFPYGSDVPRPYVEFFNAEVSAVEYTSGATTGWKPIFYVVLAGVLVMNVFCLVYFSCVRNGFVTDWTEVQNLFCIAMDGGALRGGNAGYKPIPMDMRDERWKGTGGTGPVGGQYKVGFWFTEKDGRWYVTDEVTDEKGAKTTGFSRMV